MECLLYRQLIAMRAAGVIDPGPFVQPGCLGDKRVVVYPFSNGVAVPSRLQNLFRKLAAVRPNIPPDLAILKNDLHLIFVLPDLHRAQVEEFYARKSYRVAARKGIVEFRSRNRRNSPSRFMRLPRLQPQRRERQLMLRPSI